MDGDVPCPSCPWRKSNPPGGADIPGFSVDLMRGLSCTVGAGDEFRRVMACHGTPEGREAICVGYAARHGYQNLNVRIMAMAGKVDLLGIQDACEGLDLWRSFGEMLAAYEQATR